jgi:hypothetical protein
VIAPAVPQFFLRVLTFNVPKEADPYLLLTAVLYVINFLSLR